MEDYACGLLERSEPLRRSTAALAIRKAQEWVLLRPESLAWARSVTGGMPTTGWHRKWEPSQRQVAVGISSILQLFLVEVITAGESIRRVR